MNAPFPYFGGKSTIAAEVWRRFGNVSCYVEPFFGSGAVLLNRPVPFNGVETINDIDGLCCNFWRALKADPEQVAQWADNPVMENELHARHAWLVGQKESLQSRLEGDPEFFDAKIAGWWCWGMACWIGGGFCSGGGPWHVQQIDGVAQLVRDHGDAGRGVNRQRVHLGDAGAAGDGEQGLYAWFDALARRLERVRVCCGDWRRVCGGNSGDALGHFFACGEPCGVFLDPPYSAEANRDNSLYRCENSTVAHDVREWCIAHGDDQRLRIAFCGYDTEHAMPDNWTRFSWKAQGGMANVSDDEESQGKLNAHREVIWFSPHCLDTETHLWAAQGSES